MMMTLTLSGHRRWRSGDSGVSHLNIPKTNDTTHRSGQVLRLLRSSPICKGLAGNGMLGK